MRRFVVRTVTASLLFVSGLVPVSACAQDNAVPSVETRIFDLSKLWQEANYNFVFFDKVPDLDWDSAYQAFIPRVMQAETRMEHIRVLQEFYALLREGHTNVVPPGAMLVRLGAKPPVALDVVSGGAVVTNVDRSLADQVPIGSTILTVDGISTDEYLAERVFPMVSAATPQDRLRKAVQGKGEPGVGLLLGLVDTSVALDIRTPSGEVRKVTLVRRSPEALVDWVRTPVDSLPIFDLSWTDDDIAVVQLNGFHDKAVAEEFEEAFPAIRARARAIVLDVRLNGGGNGGYAWVVAKHFLTKPVLVSRSRSRENISSYRARGRFSTTSKYRPYWEGSAFTEDRELILDPSEVEFLDVPAAVLIGHNVYSAAEDFLAVMRQAPRAFFVGAPTAGSTGQPLIMRLPGGAFAAVTSKRDMLPDGTDIVGSGFQPDVPAAPTPADIAAQRDVVLETALRELRAGR